MKLAALSLLSLASVVAAQDQSPQALQHGISEGTQAAHLFGEGDGIVCPVPSANGQIRNLLALYGGAASGGSGAGSGQPATPCAQFEVWVENLGADFSESVVGGLGGVQGDTNKTTIQRFVRDNLRMVYASYSVTVEKLPQSQDYRVSFGASNAAPPADLKAKTDWKVVSPANYPVPQVIRDGDEVRIELFRSDKGALLADYVHVGRQDKLKQRKQTSRDSYAEDSEFTITQPKLRVNGVSVEPIMLPETLRGGVLWIYIPGLGRYVLSFLPHPEFNLAGEVEGNGMTLRTAGNIFRVECAERIAAGGGAYNVYARRDISWVPADPEDRARFLAGTSPGVETALGR